jgi:hypothetical protein
MRTIVVDGCDFCIIGYSKKKENKKKETFI